MSCVSAKTTEAATPSARYTIINLLQRAGHTLGLSRPMIEHLAYLVRHTQEVDWQPGNRAIVYKSVTLMARDNGISERQIHNRERELIDTLDLEHIPSGNFRRYGYRNKETGRITRAFGIDITALRDHVPLLEKAVAADEAAEILWRARKQELSALKGRLRKLMDAAVALGLGNTLEALQARYAGYLSRVRAETTTEEIEMRIFNARALKDALERALLMGKTTEQPVETSDRAEVAFRHKDSSTDLQTNNDLFEGKVSVDKPSPTATTKVTRASSTARHFTTPSGSRNAVRTACGEAKNTLAAARSKHALAHCEVFGTRALDPMPPERLPPKFNLCRHAETYGVHPSPHRKVNHADQISPR